MFTLIWIKFKGYIIGALSLLAIILGIYEKGRMDQKASTDAANAKKRINDIKEAQKINEEVRNSSDASLDNSLSKWMRD